MPDVGLQAGQNTVDQISLFQHDRVGAALLLPGGTVVINVLFPLDRVGFPGHAPAAAAAYQQAGEQIDRLAVRGRAGVQAGNFLNQVKIPFLDDRLMGVFNANPFLRWLMDDILQLTKFFVTTVW